MEISAKGETLDEHDNKDKNNRSRIMRLNVIGDKEKRKEQE